MINKYDTGNIIDLLGTINIDLDDISSLIKLIRCNLSYAESINVSDSDGSIIAYKDDVLNYLETTQKQLNTIMQNIKDIQNKDEIKSIRYKVGGN